MKKLLKILTISVALLTAIAIFTSCDQLIEDPKDFFEYWTSEVIPKDFSISGPQTMNSEGILCVPSASDVTLTINLHNPRKFSLVMPTNSADAGKVIYFPGFSTQPTYGGTNYTLVQTANDKLELKYDAEFLKKHEWSFQNIGPEITFISTDGRKFSKKFSLNLKVDTPPPTPTAVLAKTTTLPATYVLCLQVPDMNTPVTGGQLHEDIKYIEINGTPYQLILNGVKTDFVKPSDSHFITAAAQLSGYPSPPSGAWVLYYDTDLAVGSAYTPYAVRLKDKNGLVSETLNTGTARPPLSAETVNVIKGTKVSGLGSSQTDPVIINGDTTAPEAQIEILQNTAGTTVHCTVKDLSDFTSTSYNSNPVIAPLRLNGVNDKLYEVEYYTDGDGYTPTPTKTVYYKVRKSHRVTFNSNGGTFASGLTSYSVLVPHGTPAAAPFPLPTKTGYHIDGWCTNAACTTQWDFSVSVTSNQELYAKWVPNTYTVKFHVNGGTGSMGDQSFTYGVWQNLSQNTFSRIGYTFAGWATSADGPKSYNDQQSVSNLTADNNGIVNLYAVWTPNTYTVKFHVNGGAGYMSDQSFTYGVWQNLSPNTFTKANHRFIGWAITPTGPKSYNDQQSVSNLTTANNGVVHLYAKWAENPKITFKVEDNTGGSLTCYYNDGTNNTSSTAGGSNPPSRTVSVKYGSNVSFTATPTNATWKVAEWTVSSGSFNSGGGTGTSASLNNVTADKTVTVKFYPTEINGGGLYAWRALKKAVKDAPAGATIKISGTITATSDNGNNGEIEITKNITIKGKTQPATLDADNRSRIFKVTSGTLTLDSMSLIKGNAGTDYGGAIYADGGSTLKLMTVAIGGAPSYKNKAFVGGGIYLSGSGTTGEMTNSIILYNEATGSSGIPQGGGVCVQSLASFTMNSGNIRNNTSSKMGGGVSVVNYGKFFLKGGNIKDNTSQTGGGVMVHNNGTFEMSGGTIIGNTASSNNGHGVYVEKNCKMKMSGNAKIDTGNHVYLSKHAKITVDSNLFNNPAAKIRPKEYEEGLTVLDGDGVSLHYGKFELVPEPGNNWTITSNGQLHN